MFDLEKSLADWRKQMLAAGIKTPVPLEELECHLREEIGKQIRFGTAERKAFEVAVTQMGKAEPLKMEFKKIDAKNWNRPLAWAAWVLFVLSFFLPALGDGLGWRCAGLSATAISWPDFWHNWWNIHLASLTLANLLMVASPFLLPRLSQSMRFMKWWRVLNFLAVAVVWSFLLPLLTHAERNDLMIGCYVWGLSFLLLCLSTLRIRSRKTLAAQYV